MIGKRKELPPLLCGHGVERDCLRCATDELARAQRRVDVLRQTALQKMVDVPEMIFDAISPTPATEALHLVNGAAAQFIFYPQRSLVGPFLISITPYESVLVTGVEIANNHLFVAPGGVPAVDLIARPWEERPELRFFRIHSEEALVCGMLAKISIANDGPERTFRATIYGRSLESFVRERGRVFQR